MYLDYFSLKRHPFRITPDTSLFYSGGETGRGVVLDAMLYAIENGEGILKVVGEVGSGKTMLCRMLEERLPETTEIVYLANPNLNLDDILYAIAFDLKLPVRRDTSRLLVMQQLQNYLMQQHAANRKVLIAIEEAQSMPYETLEEIRLLSNLETKRDKLMQIILFGQPELDKLLSAKNIRQLRERITHSFYLSPLTTEEIADYIRFRIGAAGCPCPQLLTKQAERLIAEASMGMIRRVNILTDKALLAAYSDNVLNSGKELNPGVSPMIERKHVAAAIRDSDYPLQMWQLFLSPLRLVSASMLTISVAVALLLWPKTSQIADQSAQDQPQLPTLSITSVVQDISVLKPETLPSPSAGVLEPIAATTFSNEDSTSFALDDDRSDDHYEAVREETGNEQTSKHQKSNDEIARGKGSAALAVNEVVDTLANEAAQIDTRYPKRDVSASGQQQGTTAIGKPAARKLTRARVLATVDWLERADQGSYTIQFIYDGAEDLFYAETFLGVLDRAGLIDDSYVCISSDGKADYWTVKYGNFSSLTPAQRFVDGLPAAMNKFKPFVQNMNQVRCNTNSTVAALIVE